MWVAGAPTADCLCICSVWLVVVFIEPLRTPLSSQHGEQGSPHLRAPCGEVRCGQDEGGLTSWCVEVEGSRPAAEISWWKDGEAIQDDMSALLTSPPLPVIPFGPVCPLCVVSALLLPPMPTHHLPTYHTHSSPLITTISHQSTYHTPYTSTPTPTTTHIHTSPHLSLIVNKPGRTPGSGQKERSIWEESRAQELIQRVLNKELSLTAAAVRLGVDTNTFFAHLTDNGKNKSRVALLLGTDNSSSENTFGNANHSEDSNSANAAVDAVGDDSNPPENSGGLVSEDSNMESIAENSHNGSEVNGEKDDSEEPEIIDDSNTTVRSSEHIPALEEITVEGNDGDDQIISDQGSTDQPMESFQSMVEEESGNMYTETT
ncbi:hypothetical protein C7M84_019139 [Penaeus vannamei]|uniref:Ig-like domain-containing protein n=1 Tax=Penaeus vannamei TaxID=6689 RepID=A0A423SFQ2_PENVA|nr:hypothetical protein C7M84_019139 [Penaeus vannamei]